MNPAMDSVHGETTSEPSSGPLYAAQEIDFMLNLRPTAAAKISREQLNLHQVPEEAREHVAAAVAAGLKIRGKLTPDSGGAWQLGDEAHGIALALTEADRWLGIGLADGQHIQLATVVKARQAALMLTQDDLDTFAISAMPDHRVVPSAISTMCRSFLAEQPGRTVSLRVTTSTDPARAVPAMFHGEADGSWTHAHLPINDDAELTVSDLEPDHLHHVVTALWEEQRSEAL